MLLYLVISLEDQRPPQQKSWEYLQVSVFLFVPTPQAVSLPGGHEALVVSPALSCLAAKRF